MPLLLSFLTFLVALVYSSVGHGGASGYLALLSFFEFSPEEMAASALCLNLLVAAVAFWNFFRASHFSWKLTWPFAVTSVPFAFLGGLLKISAAFYSLFLAGVLVFAAFRLLVTLEKGETIAAPPPFAVSLPVGAGIGFVSGIAGVGGGIFLSPLLVLCGWGGVKQAAAVSAFFIWVNSLAGLLGRFARHSFTPPPNAALLVAAAFVGGVLGSRLGANHFSAVGLKRLLAAVLIAASFKLIYPLL